jgi:MFS family permease
MRGLGTAVSFKNTTWYDKDNGGHHCGSGWYGADLNGLRYLRLRPLTGLWLHPDFRRLWLGQTISEFGSMMGALSLLAILAFHASPVQMGLLEMLHSAPALILGLFAGVWVDRRRRRPLLIGADVGRFLLLMGIVLLTLTGWLRMELLYLAAFLIGCLTVLFGIAYRSYLPTLVEREQLLEANGKLSATEALADITSPAVGGLLVQVVSVMFAALIDAMTYLVSAIFLVSIQTPEPTPVSNHEQSVWSDIKSGLHFVWSSRPLRALALATATWTFFGSFFAALYALYILRQIGLSPAMLGLFIGAGGVGAFFGALIVGRVTGRLGVGYTLIGALLFSGSIGWLVPLAAALDKTTATAVLLINQLVGDIAIAIFLVTQISLRQQLTPDAMLGRMNASFEFLVGGAGTVGIMVGGLLGEWLGIRQSLSIAVLGVMLAALWLLHSPVRTMKIGV